MYLLNKLNVYRFNVSEVLHPSALDGSNGREDSNYIACCDVSRWWLRTKCWRKERQHRGYLVGSNQLISNGLKWNQFIIERHHNANKGWY